jgi:pyruvate ferredoxin oxidoreductase gamma subunit
MQKTSLIPKKNQWGFFEIRMESIGGLGANVAGKILGEAVVLKQGFNGSNFSSYGSEKKGTPVKTFIRICDSETLVNINSPVEEPHILAVFHEGLFNDKNVVSGLIEDGILIVNTRKPAKEIRELISLHCGTIVTIDALEISIAEKSRINMVMLGAIVKASGFIDPDAVKEVIKKMFEKKYALTIPSNLKAFDRGFSEGISETFLPDNKYAPHKFERYVPKLGYLNAPIGGTIISCGNTILKNLSFSRQGFIPVLHPEKCIHCAECDAVCPDYCFVFKEEFSEKHGRKMMFLKGINYQFCKGCMKCVEICKPKALTKEKEAEFDVAKLTLKEVP